MHGRSVSTVTAYTAHREWASRPPDERFASVSSLYFVSSFGSLTASSRTGTRSFCYVGRGICAVVVARGVARS